MAHAELPVGENYCSQCRLRPFLKQKKPVSFRKAYSHRPEEPGLLPLLPQPPTKSPTRARSPATATGYRTSGLRTSAARSDSTCAVVGGWCTVTLPAALLPADCNAATAAASWSMGERVSRYLSWNTRVAIQLSAAHMRKLLLPDMVAESMGMTWDTHIYMHTYKQIKINTSLDEGGGQHTHTHHTHIWEDLFGHSDTTRLPSTSLRVTLSLSLCCSSNPTRHHHQPSGSSHPNHHSLCLFFCLHPLPLFLIGGISLVEELMSPPLSSLSLSLSKFSVCVRGHPLLTAPMS